MMANEATLFVYRLGDELAGIRIRAGLGAHPIPVCLAAHDIVIAIPVIEPGQPAPVAGVEEIARPVPATWLADLLEGPAGGARARV